MNYHALVIGIDEYPLLRRMTPGGQPLGDLKGCVNDARRMAQVLCQRYLFPAAHVTLLINEQASREGILGGLADLLRRIDPGDVAVMFDDRNRFVAVGLWDPGSPIRIKVLQASTPVEVGAELWNDRLAHALARRRPPLVRLPSSSRCSPNQPTRTADVSGDACILSSS